MSIPLSVCSFYNNLDNHESFKEIVKALHKNLEGGSFTLLPCPHDPRCKPISDEQVQKVLNKIGACVKELQLDRDIKRTHKKKNDNVTIWSCECGKGKMVRRKNSKTGEEFLGCSEFPRCMKTQPIIEEDELNGVKDAASIWE